jgi:hypothetical protein
VGATSGLRTAAQPPRRLSRWGSAWRRSGSRSRRSSAGGQQAPPGHISFTPRAKKALELSLREVLQFGDDHIGTEHILLGLIREGQGVAAQVLVKRGADLHRVRRQVIQPLHSYEGKESASADARWQQRQAADISSRVSRVESRLSAVEQRVGIEPDTADLDQQIGQVRSERHAADLPIDAKHPGAALLEAPGVAAGQAAGQAPGPSDPAGTSLTHLEEPGPPGTIAFMPLPREHMSGYPACQFG